MKDDFRKRYAARAAIAKALSHPSRLQIVDELQAGERCVGDLAATLEVDQSVISKHLGVLKNVGLVDCRREGTTSHYRITVPCLTGFWDCLDAVLRRNLEAHRAAIGS